MKTLIESMKCTLEVLRAAAAARKHAKLEITFHENKSFKARDVTDIAPHLIMFDDPNAPVNLSNFVANQHTWPRSITRTYTVTLMATTEVQFKEIARAFDGVVMTIEDVSTRVKTYAEFATENTHVCYDELCFRQTCKEFGVSDELADEWMLKLAQHETKSNIGWIVLKTVPKDHPNVVHMAFLEKYVAQYEQMVAA